MCGIAGYVSFNGLADEALVRSMTQSIAHRGPDGDGFFFRDGMGFGHRRLAIIDIGTGQQPMVDAANRACITYNGEVYNYKELRDDLKQRGFTFITNSDTEVIVNAYLEWGHECVKKLRGMFAFCIADFEKRELFLARDPFGIKPLLYTHNKSQFAFGSELSAIVASEVPLTGNLEAVEYFLRYQYIPAPHTIYNEVRKLLPGHYFSVSFSGQMSKPVRYWELQFGRTELRPLDDWVNQVDEVLRESVKAHLVADVPFGVFLSGGIDSTLVAGQMNNILGDGVRAFAIGFSNSEYNELDYAKKVAEKYGIDLHSEIVEDDGLEILPDLINNHYGEPFGDSSALPTWYVSKLARSEVPMVLSGDGGDEIFGGYHSYARWLDKTSWNLARNMAISGRIHKVPRFVLGSALRYIRNGFADNYSNVWVDGMMYAQKEVRHALWRNDAERLSSLPDTIFDEVHSDNYRLPRLSYAQKMDIHTYLPYDILTKVDIASMYHGLEVRPPIIDKQVAELATLIPPLLRYDRKGEYAGKQILKKILEKQFPDEFVRRPKMGFGIPRDHWFLEGGGAHELLAEYLADDSSSLHDLFEVESIQRLMHVHSLENDKSNVLWLILVMAIWCEGHPNIVFAN